MNERNCFFDRSLDSATSSVVVKKRASIVLRLALMPLGAIETLALIPTPKKNILKTSTIYRSEWAYSIYRPLKNLICKAKHDKLQSMNLSQDQSINQSSVAID
jgi:hypothetical protein